MTRKKGKKCNIQIGIFTGKSKVYNKAVMEALYRLNAATDWQIAKNIQGKLKYTPNKEIADSRSRKIYSVIQRKGGRLNDLQEKGYIEYVEGLWKLTFKGNIALAITDPSKLESESMEVGITRFEEVVKNIPNGVVQAPLGISIDRSAFKNGFGTVSQHLRGNPSIFRLVVEEAKELVKGGINLDVIDSYQLASLLLHKKTMKSAISKLVASFNKTGN